MELKKQPSSQSLENDFDLSSININENSQGQNSSANKEDDHENMDSILKHLGSPDLKLKQDNDSNGVEEFNLHPQQIVTQKQPEPIFPQEPHAI